MKEKKGNFEMGNPEMVLGCCELLIFRLILINIKDISIAFNMKSSNPLRKHYW